MSAREFADLLQGFGPALANHLWQSTAFAALAAGLAFALRRNQARARYGLWITASVKFLVPFALLAATAGRLAPPRVVASANAGVYMAVDEMSEPFVVPAASAPSETPEAPPVHWGALTLAALWALGFCGVLITWCVRWRRVARVARLATPVSAGREIAALERIAAQAGVRQRIRIRLSESALEPGVFGVVRPVLLWPVAISERLADEQLDAVLAHEVCHVRRRDNLTAVLHMFVEAVFWFHPLVWWMGARLLAERERACDEAVVALCPQPQVYAESILKVCEFCVESPLVCVSGITGADLKRRIADIMTARVVRSLTVGAKIAIAAAVTLAVAVPVVLGTTRVLPIYGEIPKPSGPLPSFEAVTIKPARPDAQGKGFGVEGRHFRSVNTTAADLVLFAYGVQASQVEGAPAWTDTEAYDVTAVAPASSAGDIDWKLAVQKLLADRFGFSFHTGTKEMAVYELHVGKNGPRQMTIAPEGEHGALSFSKSASGPGTTIHARSATMAGFAKLLQDTQFDRPVIDRTAIAGKFDFEMTFLSDHFKGKPIGPPVEDEPNAPPGIFAAIQEQLGLKLEPAKGPTETLVIDHIEKPELDGADAAGSSANSVAPARLQTVAQVWSTGAAAAMADTPAFAVASVKPSGPDSPYRSVKFLPGGHFLATGVTVRVLTKIAYNLNDDQLSGGPAWIAFKRFDIEAKPDPAASERTKAMTGDQLKLYNRQLLQSLLSDRFKLKLRTDMKDMPVYALVVGRNGPRLKVSTGAAAAPQATAGTGLITGKGASMDDLTRELEEAVRHPVQNLTGLNGAYDFRLEWAPDPGMAAANPLDAASQQNDVADSGPTLFAALQQQLGLRLDRRNIKAPYEAVEHVELPAEN